MGGGTVWKGTGAGAGAAKKQAVFEAWDALAEGGTGGGGGPNTGAGAAAGARPGLKMP